jgi:hypothetical protein
MAGSPTPGEGRKRLLLLLRDKRTWAAVAVFACSSGVAFTLARDNGFMWAENDYLDDMDRIPLWASELWKLGLRQGIATLTHSYWETLRYWNPHPPLYKYLGILSKTVLPGVAFPTAERIPTMLMFAACCTVIFLSLSRRRGWLAGLVGAASLAFMPRFATYSGYCTPDMPEAVSWLFIALAYERYETTRRWEWFLLTAAIFSFAMGCKISALVMIPALGCLMLLWRVRKGWREVLKGSVGLALVLLVGLIALAVVFPFTWPAPVSRIFLLFDEARAWGKAVHFTALFRGKIVPYTSLPWYFVPTMLVLVTPPLTLALGLVGLAWPRRTDSLWQALAVMLGFWFLFLLLPNTPKYDNDRQLLMLFPFLAMLAGMGAQDVLDRLSVRVQPKVRSALVLLLGPMVVVVTALELLGALPVPLSYYSELVGGLPGAARLGFEPTYAMEVLSKDVLGGFQESLPAGARLTTIPAPAFSTFLQARGYLRSDLQLAPSGGPFFLLVNRHNVFSREGINVKAHGQLLQAYRKETIPLAELWYLPQTAPSVEQ